MVAAERPSACWDSIQPAMSAEVICRVVVGEQEQELLGGAIGAAGVGGAARFIGFGNLSGCAKITIEIILGIQTKNISSQHCCF
jgi:hypothetical protein